MAKTFQDYQNELESLLKRNTGQGLYVGQDVSSNTPMYIPGRVRDPGGIGETAPSIAMAGNGMDGIQDATPTPQGLGIIPTNQDNQSNDSSPSGIDSFLDQWESAVSNPQPQNQAVRSTQDGGSVSTDGNIYYSDGTMRRGDENAYAVASVPGGGYRYSDGSTREVIPYATASLGHDENNIELLLYTDGTVRYGSPQGTGESTRGGLSDLMHGIFGQDQTITQKYGNINPIEPTPGNVNYGTDIRTRNLSGEGRNLKIPVGAEVVQVLKDDGTRFGTRSGHKGYGNSILLRLSTGEMLRFSHLSDMIDVNPGDKLTPGEIFGKPGATGNTYGEHLDLEYYNENGEHSDPSNFSGYTNPVKLYGDKAPGTQVPQEVSQRLGRLDNPQETMSGTPTNQPSVPPQDQGDVLGSQTQYNRPIDQVKQIGQLMGHDASALVGQAKGSIASGINTANPTGEFDLGMTEKLQGDSEAARLAQIKTVENLPFGPETQATEMARDQGTNVFRQFAGNVADIVTTPLKKLGLPDFGGSEWLAGGKTVNTDFNLAPQAGASEGQISSKPPSAKDYAGVLGSNIKGMNNAALDFGTQLGESAKDQLGKAGEGISNLAQGAVSSLQNVFKPKVDEVKRAIGDVSGTADNDQSPGQFSSLMDTATSVSNMVKNDNRDPFFKQGGADMYSKLMTPGFNEREALSLNTFTPDFYKDLGNISSVFGGSKDLSAATNKYIDYEKQKYPTMSRMSGGDGYDQGAVDDYNRQIDSYNNSLNQYFGSILGSISSAPSIFTPGSSSSSKNIFANQPGSRTAAPIMSGRSFAGPQLATSRPSAPSVTMSRPSSPSSNNASFQGQAVYRGPSAPQQSQSRPSASQPRPSNTFVNKVTQPVAKQLSQPKPVAKPAPQIYKPQVNLTQMMRQVSTPKPQSQPKQSNVSRVVNAVKNIFRRK